MNQQIFLFVAIFGLPIIFILFLLFIYGLSTIVRLYVKAKDIKCECSFCTFVTSSELHLKQT